MAILTTKKETRKNMAGGKGEVHIEHLLNAKELNGKCAMFARVTVPVGSSLGYHQHKGNAETYVIEKGRALYNDNGKEKEIGVGAVTFCPDGEYHGISNEHGTEDLVFTALVINA